MIVCNFHVVRVAFAPTEANAPLIVDTDAITSFPVAFQPFEPVPRRRAQIIDSFGRIENQQLPKSRPEDGGGKTPRSLSIKEPFRIPVAEISYHFVQ